MTSKAIRLKVDLLKNRMLSALIDSLAGKAQGAHTWSFNHPEGITFPSGIGLKTLG